MWKYKITTFLFLLIGICSFSFVSAKTNALPLFQKVIYLDPGHGYPDPGAMYKEIKEADINLEIAYQTQKALEQMGAIVYLTRYGDYDLSVPYTNNHKRSDLSRRANIINQSMCDLYLSIHLNAETSSTWKGSEVYYDEINPENEKIATIFQSHFKKSLNSRRKLKKSSTLYLSKQVERPGILMELGFLSNPNDRYLLQQKTYQQKIANTITNATIEYFKTK